MANKSKGNKGTAKKAKAPANNPQRPPRSRDKRAAAMHEAARDWLRLLADPCNGKLSRPCYAGTDGGYLIRTTDVIKLATAVGSGTPNTPFQGSAIFTYQPYNVSTGTGIIQAVSATGTLPGPSQAGLTNFITTSTSVKSYRPVAACLKWLPDGTYSARSGTVGLLSSPSRPFDAGAAVTTVDNYLAEMMHAVPNGGEKHEVIWLPTPYDENFTTVSDSGARGSGAVTLVLRNVDGVVDAAGFPTLNGRVELVTVWEWQPAVAGNVTLNTQAPLPYTSQFVLSTIKDIGNFVYGGAMRAMGQLGYGAAAGVLTAGVRGFTRREPAMLLT